MRAIFVMIKCEMGQAYTVMGRRAWAGGGGAMGVGG
jgi:hypothetical protein